MKRQYPMGTVSHATMRGEDLILTFTHELRYQLKHGPKQNRATRKAHFQLIHEIEASIKRLGEDYWRSEDAIMDLNEGLFDALDCYSAPYFYFGAHPGDGSDYGWWLIDDWEDCFDGLKVSDLAEVPKGYSGEVMHVNDHGNMTLYAYSHGHSREVWSIV